MALPDIKESIKNLFPDIDINDVKMVDFWRKWVPSEEFKQKVKVVDDYIIKEGEGWDDIAEDLYEDRRLWWVVAMFNNIEDPFSIHFETSVPDSTRRIKVIKPNSVNIIVAEIRSQRVLLEKQT